MTLREILKTLSPDECVKVYIHGCDQICGYVRYFDLDCEHPTMSKNVGHIEALEHRKLLIILK